LHGRIVGIPIQDFQGDTVTVRLCQLANEFEDQEYEVPLRPTPDEPVFIFRESDGRKLQLPQIRGERDVDVEINPGDYTLVLAGNCTTDNDELFQLSADGHRYGQLPLDARDDPLTVNAGERTISIRPRLISGIRVGGPDSNVLTDSNGQRIFFGEPLDVLAHVPEEALGENEEIVMSVSNPAATGVEPMEIALLKPDTDGAFCFFELWDCLIQPFLDGVESGIHQLEIRGNVKSRSFGAKFYYWKGLDSVSKAEGFRCSEMPRNIDWDNSTGLRREEAGLEINPQHPGPVVSLAITRPYQVFLLSKPGLWISVYSTENYAEEHLQLGDSFEINSVFQQEVRLVSGDQCDWDLYCGNSHLTRLTHYRPKYRLPAAALLGDYGDAGTIVARDPLGNEVDLFSFARASVARDLTFEPGTDSGHTKASFRLGCDSISQLRVTARNFASRSDEVWKWEMPFEAGSRELAVPGLSEPIRMKLEPADNDLVVSVDAETLNSEGGLYFLDFAICKKATGTWFPLKVAERHNLSDVRLAISALLVNKGEGDYWGQFLSWALARTYGTTATEEMPLPESIEDVAAAIEKFQSALLFKYPSQVWPHVAWIKTAYHGFCQSAFSSADDDRCRLFAERALYGLARKERETLSVLSALLMGHQVRLLALPGRFFPKPKGEGMTERCFEKLQLSAGYESLAVFVREHPTAVDMELYLCFANAPMVAANQAPEFADFDHRRLSERFRSAFERYQRTRERESAFSLLSPRHLLEAVRPLNRRLRPFEEVRNDETAYRQLAKYSGWIRLAKNRVFRVWPALDRNTGIPMQQDEQILHFDQIVEMDLAEEAALVLCAVAGLGRLAAGGLLTGEEYLQHLVDLFKTDDATAEDICDRLSLVLGLGPEVFAFFMLFWELLLKPKARNS